jgi:hypothetical protein
LPVQLVQVVMTLGVTASSHCQPLAFLEALALVFVLAGVPKLCCRYPGGGWAVVLAQKVARDDIVRDRGSSGRHIIGELGVAADMVVVKDARPTIVLAQEINSDHAGPELSKATPNLPFSQQFTIWMFSATVVEWFSPCLSDTKSQL